MDKRTNGQINRRTHGQTDRRTDSIYHACLLCRAENNTDWDNNNNNNNTPIDNASVARIVRRGGRYVTFIHFICSTKIKTVALQIANEQDSKAHIYALKWLKIFKLFVTYFRLPQLSCWWLPSPIFHLLHFSILFHSLLEATVRRAVARPLASVAAAIIDGGRSILSGI